MITMSLVVANAAVFILMLMASSSLFTALSVGDPTFIDRYKAVPSCILGDTYCTSGLSGIVTSIFVHAGVMHFAFNMLTLFSFGRIVENAGKALMLAGYIGSGLAGVVALLVMTPEDSIGVVGASGAICGIMGMVMVYFPTERIRVMFVNVPLAVYMGVWFVLFNVLPYLAQSILGFQFSYISYVAHIGGFVFGITFAVITRLAYRHSDTHGQEKSIPYKP